MNRIMVIALFVIGIALATSLNVIAWFRLDDAFYAPLFFAVLLAAIILSMIGFGSMGRERWLTLVLASVLFLGLALGSWFSAVGFLLAPIAIAFFIISALKLAKKPS